MIEPQSEEERKQSSTQASNDFLHSLGEKLVDPALNEKYADPALILASVLWAGVTGMSISLGSVEGSIFSGIWTAMMTAVTIKSLLKPIQEKDKK